MCPAASTLLCCKTACCCCAMQGAAGAGTWGKAANSQKGPMVKTSSLRYLGTFLSSNRPLLSYTCQELPAKKACCPGCPVASCLTPLCGAHACQQSNKAMIPHFKHFKHVLRSSVLICLHVKRSMHILVPRCAACGDVLRMTAVTAGDRCSQQSFDIHATAAWPWYKQ